MSLRLLPWSPLWAGQAAQLGQRLGQALAPLPVHIEPIGSTAVPGLSAKPVLDLMLGLPGLELLQAREQAALATLGFRYRPEHEVELPERRYFTRDALGAEPRVHLHGLVQGGVLWRRHLAFRDALRTDAGLRARYQSLKEALAAQHAADKAAYQAAKAPFIQAELKRLGL